MKYNSNSDIVIIKCVYHPYRLCNNHATADISLLSYLMLLGNVYIHLLHTFFSENEIPYKLSIGKHLRDVEVYTKFNWNKRRHLESAPHRQFWARVEKNRGYKHWLSIKWFYVSFSVSFKTMILYCVCLTVRFL